MDHRSRTLRRGPALSAALIVLVPLVGCQSTAQSDLVARELRIQEDQIYALEDYLAQYQRLLRQCRAENAALRHQRSTEQGAGAPASPRSTESGPSQPEVTEPDVPPLDIPELQVPPVEETPPEGGQSVMRRSDEAASQVEHDLSFSAPSPPTIEPPLNTEALSTGVPRAIDLSPSRSAVADIPEHVRLRGEVLPNPEGGPRLLVYVEPLASDGLPSPFAGSLSLMVLAPGGAERIARWDFSADEARMAAADSSDLHAMEFRLELPPETPRDQPAELWVRLVRGDGGKLLTKAPLELQRPSRFASAPVKLVHEQPPAPEQADIRLVERGQADRDQADGGLEDGDPEGIVHAGQSESSNADADADIVGGGWTIARPGERASLADSTSSSAGGWRASSEPIPIAVAQSTPQRSLREAPAVPLRAAPSRYPVQQATHLEPTQDTPTPPPALVSPPVWSPTR